MTYPVNTLIGNASVLLQDPTNVRWPVSELVQWMNDGQREIAAYKPNAFIKNMAVATIAGTKQAIPTVDGISLIDIVRNMGAGTTPGNAIRLVSREILDSQVLNWHSITAVTVFKHYCYNLLDPKTYYVYPPSTGASAFVDMIYIAAPTDVAAGGNIALDDIYAAVLLNYVIYRAYSKDAEYAQNAQLAQAYYAAFQAQLGAKATAEVISNPNVALGAANPNVIAPGGQK